MKNQLLRSLSLVVAVSVLAACGGSSGPSTAPVISSFTATPTTIFVGQSSTLKFAVLDATSITIDNSVTVAASATTATVSPTATTIYKLTATNSAGSTTATATVTVTVFNSAAAINTYLEGKTMVMTGADIPLYPNGFNENTNYGAATQCYNKTSISVLAGTWNVTTLLGTLNGAASVGATGTCDNATVLGSAEMFSSTAVAISNVQGNATCFDIDVTYPGFGQEGRGMMSADGKTVTLELYFTGQATGDRCANGAVGSGVTLNTHAFSSDSKQVYRVQ